jgi:ADP-ribosylglycohydrolase
MTMDSSRLARALAALEGLSVGDAFGERFFLHPHVVEGVIAARAIPAVPWPYTDDTEMALSIVAQLRQAGRIDPDRLAASFAVAYDPARGYGPAMNGLLRRLGAGEAWQTAAPALFADQGSFGNGAAMRVAPLGAYFADDLDLVIEQARLSAIVTHAHPEAVAGAIAVAVAAAVACHPSKADHAPVGGDLLDLVLPHVPESEVRERIARARDLPADSPVRAVVAAVGNGARVTAQDTVPFALWCAARHLDDFEAALWLTVSGLGDVDTTCAIVGGIVAAHTGSVAIPPEWRQAREALPAWAVGVVPEAATVTLYRPVGPHELALIRASGWRAFPPRLPGQPIFYPVFDEAYAVQIARDWNARGTGGSGAGYVTRFQVEAEFVSRFPVQMVGATLHRELWVPAEALDDFNRHIVGPIEVIAEFHREEAGA